MQFDRNTAIAFGLMAAILLAWQILFWGPEQARREAALEAQRAAAEQTQQVESGGGLGVSDAAPVKKLLTREQALTASPERVVIKTPNLDGSINLKGARIDDLKLVQYRETLDPASAEITLLTPRGAKDAYYVQSGLGANGDPALDAMWTAPAGAVLTPETPVTLTRTQGALKFERTYSVDDQFMFTVEEKVTNTGGAAATLTPYGAVFQYGIPENLKNFAILQEGPVGVIGSELYERKYRKMSKGAEVKESGVGGWVGITNKYWLAATIPPQDESFTGEFKNLGTEENPVFRTSYELAPRTLAPGATETLTSHVFGGAKKVDILQGYEHKPEAGGLGIVDLDKAVDWGHFFFLTRPIFYTLNFFGKLTGNFGVAILLLVLIVKLIMFPLANKAFASMAKMKKLTPEMTRIRERFADDKQKQQQEMMALYQKYKINPVAGCLPMLVQWPIFYALYKTLFVTMEMRHQPFVLWIKDLSAPDPTSVFNLFGLLPFDPTSVPGIGGFLGIGVLPLIMGAAMFVQTKLNPPPADKIQAQIFALMPIMFMFMFSRFAAGLVLYWVWNTILSVAQQWIIMRRNGVEVNLLENTGLSGLFKKAAVKPGK